MWFILGTTQISGLKFAALDQIRPCVGLTTKSLLARFGAFLGAMRGVEERDFAGMALSMA